MKNSGDFGKLAKNYTSVRLGYPARVIRDIYSFLKTSNPTILDLGCGTGISTRQMARKGSKVFGCDIDGKMLAKVSKDNKDITYVRGGAEKLPFPKDFFDLITMFTSFHWFTNKKALNEIRRILKSDGAVCIVQPRHTSPFINDHKKIIEKALGLKVRTKYSKRKFEDVLTQSNFKIIESKIYRVVYKYKLEKFIKLLQTYSIWNDVPTSKRRHILKLFRNHYDTMLKNGLIYDTVDLNLICAKDAT